MAVSTAVNIARVLGYPRSTSPLVNQMIQQPQAPTAYPSTPMVNPTIPMPTSQPLVNQMIGTPTQTSSANTPQTATTSPPRTSSPLVQQMTQAPTGGTAAQRTATSGWEAQAAASGMQVPAELTGINREAYIKANLQSGREVLPPETIAAMRTDRGVPTTQQGAPGSPTPGQVGQGFLGGQGIMGALTGGAGQGGQVNMGGVNPQLMQALTSALSGQNVPQAANVPGFDPALMQILQQRASGEGVGPSFQEIVQGTYEPLSALMDQQFNTALTNTFEQMVSRGVLASGETQNTVTRMAAELGTSKAAVLGQLALDYSRERNNQINTALSQWGVLEGQRASNQVTITTANLQAAVQIQGIAMQTLTSLTAAMAQIQSGERIAGAEIGSREKIAGQQIASGEKIAGMDLASRQQIAQMQTQMQQTVAQISAQAMLQAANFDAQTAHNQTTAVMALEGIDWNRFLSDPEYAANVTNAIAIEKDIHLAIDQADAVNRQLPATNPRA